MKTELPPNVLLYRLIQKAYSRELAERAARELERIAFNKSLETPTRITALTSLIQYAATVDDPEKP